MLEAKKQGYFINEEGMKSWLSYQKKQANTYRNIKDPEYEYIFHRRQLDQAYRLYTLALANRPEVGAMNKLNKEVERHTACVLLAAAYAQIGEMETARSLMRRFRVSDQGYEYNYYTYGSRLRDKSIFLLSLVTLEEEAQALRMAIDLSKILGEKYYLHTHETSWALLALSKYIEKYGSEPLALRYTLQGGSTVDSTFLSAINTLPLEVQKAPKFTIENTAKSATYIRLITTGQQVPTVDIPTESRDMSIQVKYVDEEGAPINPDGLTIGTDFKIRVTVNYTGGHKKYLRNIALKHNMPSGWEIYNDRLSGDKSVKQSQHDYREIRDDKVYTFFDLGRRQSKTFEVKCTAAYAGRFFLPPILVEAMYEEEIHAQTKPQWIEVLPAQ